MPSTGVVYPFTGARESQPKCTKIFAPAWQRQEKNKERLACMQAPERFNSTLLKKDADLQRLLRAFQRRRDSLTWFYCNRLILERGLGITADAVKSEKNIIYEREMDKAISEVGPGPRPNLLPS